MTAQTYVAGTALLGTNVVLAIRHETYSIDLVRGTLLRSDWRDQHPVLISEHDRRYFETLIAHLSMQQGIL